jgi:hypothetical protein
MTFEFLKGYTFVIQGYVSEILNIDIIPKTPSMSMIFQYFLAEIKTIYPIA